MPLTTTDEEFIKDVEEDESFEGEDGEDNEGLI